MFCTLYMNGCSILLSSLAVTVVQSLDMLARVQPPAIVVAVSDMRIMH